MYGKSAHAMSTAASEALATVIKAWTSNAERDLRPLRSVRGLCRISAVFKFSTLNIQSITIVFIVRKMQ